jgi:hypothetical protein
VKKMEYIEWCRVWVTGANEDGGLPRLLLVGDSITESYFSRVEQELTGRFLCARLTTSRCAGDPVLKKELALLLGEFQFSMIHFNNGLHGWDYDEKFYARGLAGTVRFIKARSRGARLMWGSTTPVWQRGKPGALDPKTDRVRKRNEAALKIATRHNLPVNNLFNLVVDHPEYVSEDGVHFNPEGQEFLGRHVAHTILATATL